METELITQQLAALAQGARLAIFRRLVKAGPPGLCPSDLQAELALTPSVLSFHLKELKTAGLITVRPDGRHLYYSADFAAMNRLVAFLTENCCADSAENPCCEPDPCATS